MVRATFCPLVLLLGCLLGCGGAIKGRLATSQVAGKVTYRGEPIRHGQIRFFPVQAAGEGVRAAHGTLDSEGNYQLSTYRQGDGAICGEFQVAIESREQVPVERARRASMLGQTAGQPRSLIPSRYADPNTSGLTAHVAAGGNTIDFQLKD
jgi:hypothetical protein